MPKPVVKLSPGDFDRYPLWTFVYHITSREMDETWVKPVRRRTIPRNSYSILAGARFVTQRARLLYGFMDVTTAKRPVEIATGAIIGRSSYQVLPTVSSAKAERKGYEWSIRERERICAALREREPAIFPIQYMLCVPIDGESFLRGGWIE